MALKGVALGDVQIDRFPRFYGDVDLLVSSRNFRRAIDLYREAGYRLEHPSPWNRFFAKSVNLYDTEGRAVDMQRAIAPWCWTRHLRFRSLRARGRTVEANGAFAVGTEDALITTALAHAADLGDDHEKLVPWRDLAMLVPLVDHATVVHIARRARVGPDRRDDARAVARHVAPHRISSNNSAAHVSRWRNSHAGECSRTAGGRSATGSCASPATCPSAG